MELQSCSANVWCLLTTRVCLLDCCSVMKNNRGACELIAIEYLYCHCVVWSSFVPMLVCMFFSYLCYQHLKVVSTFNMQIVCCLWLLNLWCWDNYWLISGKVVNSSNWLLLENSSLLLVTVTGEKWFRKPKLSVSDVSHCCKCQKQFD